MSVFSLGSQVLSQKPREQSTHRQFSHACTTRLTILNAGDEGLIRDMVPARLSVPAGMDRQDGQKGFPSGKPETRTSNSQYAYNRR